MSKLNYRMFYKGQEYFDIEDLPNQKFKMQLVPYVEGEQSDSYLNFYSNGITSEAKQEAYRAGYHSVLTNKKVSIHVKQALILEDP